MAMNQELIHNLLADLKNTDLTVRERACAQLWRIWFWQKGRSGLAQIEASEQMIAAGNMVGAETVLTELVESLPDFAEAWNRRAVLYYLQEEYAKAMTDCQRVIEIVPWHFGAWHGLGLCEAAMGNYSAAITALRQALEIQPYSIENQRLLLECTAQL
jgi:tetratricopeptide (TPR) repeat protein